MTRYSTEQRNGVTGDHPPRHRRQKLSGTPTPPRPRRASWPAYAACAWSLLFAVVSFYWAAGGTIGINTQAESIQELARSGDPSFTVFLWVTGVVKLLGIPLALALVQSWGRVIPRRLLLLAAWSAGAGMSLWGGLNLIIAVAVALLRAAGFVETPADVSTFWWHLLLWDPWWLLGGLLFCAAAWTFQRNSRAARVTIG